MGQPCGFQVAGAPAARAGAGAGAGAAGAARRGGDLRGLGGGAVRPPLPRRAGAGREGVEAAHAPGGGGVADDAEWPTGGRA